MVSKARARRILQRARSHFPGLDECLRESESQRPAVAEEPPVAGPAEASPRTATSTFEAAFFVEAVEALGAKSPGLAGAIRSARETLSTLSASGVTRGADVHGKRVLDWECGRGAHAAALLQLGAREVVAIDSWLDLPSAKDTIGTLPGVVCGRMTIEQLAEDPARRGSFDLIFANTVTEHLPSLPAGFQRCFQLLSPDGVLLLNHDNYYQPVGSHDHGFLFYDCHNQVVFQGVRCWEENDCRRSSEHRQKIMRELPWTWDPGMEDALSPGQCRACPYFKRAVPWAHLLSQPEFRRVFPQPAFSTGYPRSSLNKLTPFQLRQFVIEAGFDLEAWVPRLIANEPPEELLRPPFAFHREDLKASTIGVRARRGSSPPSYG